MGRMTIGRFTDDPFTDVAQGRRARSVGIVGFIASSDMMSFIDEVLALVGRGDERRAIPSAIVTTHMMLYN